MGLLRQRADSLAVRPGDRAVAPSAAAPSDDTNDNRDLALAFLLGVFALAGAFALTVVLT